MGNCTKTRKHRNIKKRIQHFWLLPFPPKDFWNIVLLFQEIDCYPLRKHVYKFKNKDPSNPSWKLLKVDRPWGYVLLIDLARYVFHVQKMRIVRAHHPQSSFWWSFDGSSNFLGLLTFLVIRQRLLKNRDLHRQRFNMKTTFGMTWSILEHFIMYTPVNGILNWLSFHIPSSNSISCHCMSGEMPMTPPGTQNVQCYCEVNGQELL